MNHGHSCSLQSPFLKVPSLPFHSLISILSKIPSDDDSKIFWSGNLRDTLYGNNFQLPTTAPIDCCPVSLLDITHAAVTALVAKIDGNPFSDWTNLMTQVVQAAMDCQGKFDTILT